VTILLLLPVVLSILVLAAHFLREGNLFAVVGLLALVPALALRHRWVVLVARLTLWLGAGVWLYTIARFTAERIRFGQPYLRMVLILGGVAGLTALSSLVFGSTRLRARYAGRSAAPESSSREQAQEHVGADQV